MSHINDLLADAISRYPNKRALVDAEGRAYTYAELGKAVNALASQLAARITYQETTFDAFHGVAIFLRNKGHAIMCAFAAWYIGVPYLFIETDNASEARVLLKECDTPYLITDPQYAAYFGVGDAKRVFIFDQLIEGIDRLPIFSRKAIAPTVPAYLIFTSGTTSGRPKGVLVSHLGLVGCLEAHNAALGSLTNLELNEVNVALFASLKFDASVIEILLALTNGYTSHVVPPKIRKDPDALTEWYNEHRIHITILVPSFLRLLKPEDFYYLRVVFIVGEMVPRDLVDDFLRRMRVFIGCGNTEGTICTTLIECQADDAVFTVGPPIKTATVRISRDGLDTTDLREGRVLIGGLCVNGNGYFKAPDLNRKLFTQDPEKLQQREFDTGDIGYFVGDRLVISGRVAARKKINGQLISLDALNQSMAESGLLQASSFFWHPKYGVLAALVLPKGQEKVMQVDESMALAQAIRDHLFRAGFSEFAVPHMPWIIIAGTSDFTEKSQLTLAQKKARPTQYSKSVFIPSNEIERQLLASWKKVLKFDEGEPIGADETFSGLGGDSLRYAQLVSDLKTILGDISNLLNKIPVHEFSLKRLALQLSQMRCQPSVTILMPNNKPRVFLLPPLTCDTDEGVYSRLVDYFSYELTYVGPPSVFPDHITNLTQLAHVFLTQILTCTRPGAPIRLIGWSAGGVLALEIARLAQNFASVQVALIDSFEPQALLNPRLSQLRVRQELYELHTILQQYFLAKHQIELPEITPTVFSQMKENRDLIRAYCDFLRRVGGNFPMMISLHLMKIAAFYTMLTSYSPFQFQHWENIQKVLFRTQSSLKKWSDGDWPEDFFDTTYLLGKGSNHFNILGNDEHLRFIAHKVGIFFRMGSQDAAIQTDIGFPTLSQPQLRQEQSAPKKLPLKKTHYPKLPPLPKPATMTCREDIFSCSSDYSTNSQGPQTPQTPQTPSSNARTVSSDCKSSLVSKRNNDEMMKHHSVFHRIDQRCSDTYRRVDTHEPREEAETPGFNLPVIGSKLNLQRRTPS